jgi:hypothetical protein
VTSTPCSARKGRQVFLPGLGQDGEVAAVDDPHAQRPGLSHEVPEVRVQLRRTAREVQRRHLARPQHLDHLGDRVAVHHLGALRAGCDVAVQAALVALVAEVDLQGVERPAPDRREVGGGEQGQRGVHR